MRKSVAFIMFGLLAFAAPARTLEISAYDSLSTSDQSRYLVTLLDGCREFLKKRGDAEAAARLVTLFDTVAPGDSVPAGLYQFSKDLQTARQLTRETGKAFHVEHALLLTYSKFKIEMPRAEMMRDRRRLQALRRALIPEGA